MESNNLIKLIKWIGFSVFLIVGLVILLNSLDLADKEVYRIMQANGGSMDTGKYLIYLEQSITKYRFLGSILSFLGGLGLVLMLTNDNK